MTKPVFHELFVNSVRALTDQSVAIQFALPDALIDAYSFSPGQYLTLRATVGGQDIRRSYSVCSALGDPLEVGIKRLEGGLFSTYAQQLKVGGRLQVMTPQGNFKINPGGYHQYLLIAAGSGITPCLSMIKTVLQQEPASHVTLLYGNRSTDTIMFRQDISDLKDSYTERFSVINVMSAERQDSQCLNGRIDSAKINYLLEHKLLNVEHCDGAYVCGPAAMVDEVRVALDGKVAMHTELFTTADQPTNNVVVNVPEDQQGKLSVKIIMDGAERIVSMNPQQETVLSAAQRAGLDLPFSCAGGMCCTCRCKVVSGDTKMDMNFSLADWEVASGFTLACQTRPLADGVVLDFDEI